MNNSSLHLSSNQIELQSCFLLVAESSAGFLAVSLVYKCFFFLDVACLIFLVINVVYPGAIYSSAK